MPRILVVDDNPLDRTLISRLFERDQDSWQIALACDGDEALEYLQEQPVDLIVTDMQMPNLDGLQLVQKVRERFNQVPVVIVTAFGSEKASVAALRAGAANFSHKSRLNLDLVPTVKNVFDWSESLKNLAADARSNEPSQKRMAFVLDNDVRQIRQLVELFDVQFPEWAEADRLRISMALDEALTNAMCHGNLEVDSGLRDEGDGAAFDHEVRQRQDCQPFCGRRVRVHAEFCDEMIRFRIQDEGPGFNPDCTADPTAPENIAKPSGRGLLLIRSFMDEVQHNPNGNEITLIKRRNHV